MDLKQIEKLMAAMEHSRIKRIVLKREDYEIEIERESAGSSLPTTTYSSPPAYIPLPTGFDSRAQMSQDPNGQVENKEKAGTLYVTSPMVGTFYASPSPEDPPFLKVGDAISEETVVCIIEAMKVMNEVKSGVKGIVSEILIKNGEPVEFGTQIMRVNPA